MLLLSEKYASIKFLVPAFIFSFFQNRECNCLAWICQKNSLLSGFFGQNHFFLPLNSIGSWIANSKNMDLYSFRTTGYRYSMSKKTKRRFCANNPISRIFDRHKLVLEKNLAFYACNNTEHMLVQSSRSVIVDSVHRLYVTIGRREAVMVCLGPGEGLWQRRLLSIKEDNSRHFGQ